MTTSPEGIGAAPDADTSRLRQIGLAVSAVANSQVELAEAVADAREQGRTWTQIASTPGRGMKLVLDRVVCGAAMAGREGLLVCVRSPGSAHGRWPLSDLEVKDGLVDSTTVHVLDCGGTGRPVVLIHGWPLSSESWQAQIPALTTAGYRVIAYDRRGFGHSDKPLGGYDYDTLTEDLEGLLSKLDLQDVTLVGFSMGGGEVARYISEYGEERVHSVVFASAVPPYMLQGSDNPEGPLTKDKAAQMLGQLVADRDGFFDQFTTEFFSVGGVLKISEQQRQDAIALCQQSSEKAALKCMNSFGTEDFRDDLLKVTVPTLVLHGSGDGIVPFEGSGARTHAAITHSQLVLLEGAPHGCNVSHADQFNNALLDFLTS